ncbi:unnamed protein product, partial [Symbiodinium natans]
MAAVRRLLLWSWLWLRAIAEEEDASLLSFKRERAQSGRFRSGALTYEWVETGPGYCRDIYGENPWQYSVSCVGKTKCKNQCTALNCVGYAWSKTPELDYDGCQTQKKARCVMYTGLGEVSLFASPPTIYTCYARRPQATGVPACPAGSAYHHTGFWLGGEVVSESDISSCLAACSGSATCYAFAWVELSTCVLYTSVGTAISDLSSVACIKPVQGDQPCFDNFWQDTSGATCRDYEVKAYCTPYGRYGTGWARDRSYDTFRTFAWNGLSAAGACCACGGGSTAKPCADYTTKESCPLRCQWQVLSAASGVCVYAEVLLQQKGKSCDPDVPSHMQGRVYDIAGCQHTTQGQQPPVNLYVCDYSDNCGICREGAIKPDTAGCSLYKFEQQTCSTGFVCPDDYEPNPENVNSTTLTRSECCQKECLTFPSILCPVGRCQIAGNSCRKLSGNYVQTSPDEDCSPDRPVPDEESCQLGALSLRYGFGGTASFALQPNGCIVVDRTCYFNTMNHSSPVFNSNTSRVCLATPQVQPTPGYTEVCTDCRCETRRIIAPVDESDACRQLCDVDIDCFFFNYDYQNLSCWACPEDYGNEVFPYTGWIYEKIPCGQLQTEADCPTTRCVWNGFSCSDKADCGGGNPNEPLAKLQSRAQMEAAGWQFDTGPSWEYFDYLGEGGYRAWNNNRAPFFIKTQLQGTGTMVLLVRNDFDRIDNGNRVTVYKNDAVIAVLGPLLEVFVTINYADGDEVKIYEEFSILWVKSIVFDCQ